MYEGKKREGRKEERTTYLTKWAKWKKKRNEWNEQKEIERRGEEGEEKRGEKDPKKREKKRRHEYILSISIHLRVYTLLPSYLVVSLGQSLQ